MRELNLLTRVEIFIHIAKSTKDKMYEEQIIFANDIIIVEINVLIQNISCHLLHSSLI